MGNCDECGAGEREGLTCRQQWDELLALEFSDARAGQVHFLTVACYQLQHPQAWPLSDEVRSQLLESLRRVVLDGMPVEEVRRQMGQRYEGTTRVVASAGAGDAAPRGWSHTVADVGPPDAEAHVDRVGVWARVVVEDLETA